MFLKNFIAWVNGNTAATLYTAFSGVNVSAGYIGGNITAYTNRVDGYYSNAVGCSYVDVGFGTTPVTKNDYKLNNSNAIDTPILTFLSNGYVLDNTYPYIRNLTTTYVNNTENDVTITEVGYAQKGNYASDSNRNVLMTRTVLDTPIVVPAGKQVAVTVSLEV